MGAGQCEMMNSGHTGELVINLMWKRREKEELMMCVPLHNREDVGNVIEKVNVGSFLDIINSEYLSIIQVCLHIRIKNVVTISRLETSKLSIE